MTVEVASLTHIALDAQQQAVVDAPVRAIVLEARAGTGKTEVVARRVERLLEEAGGDRGRILAVTYTRKAAHELKARFDARLGGRARQVDAQTLHAFAHDRVRADAHRLGWPEDPEILVRDADRVALLDEWVSSEGERLDPAELRERLHEIDRLRTDASTSPVVEGWRRTLRRAGVLDYPGLLDVATELLSAGHAARSVRRRYDHVIVDEAQNLTAAQYQLLEALLGPGPEPRLGALLAGDPDQSIVGFAGGSPQWMKTFREQFRAQVFTLSANYRSARALVAVAERVRRRQTGNFEVPHPASGRVELRVAETQADEARLIAEWVERLLEGGLDPTWLAAGEATAVEPEQLAILGRSARDLALVRRELEARDIPAAASLGTPDVWLSREGEMMRALLDFRCGDRRGPRAVFEKYLGRYGLDDEDAISAALSALDSPLEPLLRASNFDGFVEVVRSIEKGDDWGDDQRTFEELVQIYRSQVEVGARGLSSFRRFLQRELAGRALDPGVRILSIHKAQGREYRAAAVVGLNEGQLPDFRAKTTDEIEAERRVFYVAISRPTRHLLLTRSRSRETRSGRRPTLPSRFLEQAELVALPYG
jgi:DNA helicase-2/ATP-dependent DNA helicase PcrA